ncbi:hypothetical protein RJ640_000174 [Escallonia rubra]|uniref:Uncharacterized protein n=1 Tax=Escallonia rubra TaxID=112253 RepID=A0AA88RGB1_9ASTE|nr:hypothetical protein RJ640_000174 [Escallonia rubra]
MPLHLSMIQPAEMTTASSQISSPDTIKPFVGASSLPLTRSASTLPLKASALHFLGSSILSQKEQNDRSYEEPNDRTSNAYTPWVPDPVTGYYQSENQAKELGAAGLIH